MIWKYFVVGQVMGDYDTDVAEFLYKPGAQRAGLSKLLCKDLSKACVGKVPPVPKVILSTCELPYLIALLSVQCIFNSQCASHLSKFLLLSSTCAHGWLVRCNKVSVSGLHYEFGFCSACAGQGAWRSFYTKTNQRC